MTEADILHRFSFAGLPIRGQWVRLNAVLDETCARHDYPMAVSELLGQMLAAVAMLADNLKFEGTVALQSRGDGPLTRTLAECRAHHQLRGIAHLDATQSQPSGDAQRDLTAWLGDGQLALSLIPPPEQRQETYQGLIDLQHNTLQMCLESYFEISEQLPTRVFFASESTSTCTALLLQRLPTPTDTTEIELSEYEDAWETIQVLASSVTATEMATLGPEQLLSRLFATYTCRLYPGRTLEFRCTCSQEKSDRTLRVLPGEEIRTLLAERGHIDVDCEFCGQRYRYDNIDIANLLANLPAPPDDTVH